MSPWATVKPSELLVLSGILVAVIVAAGVVVLWFRHRYLGKGVREESAGFDLANFEAMRASGEISDEEFRRLRRMALGLGEGEPPVASLAGAPAEAGEARTQPAEPTDASRPLEPADAAEPSDPPEKPAGSSRPDGEDDDA